MSNELKEEFKKLIKDLTIEVSRDIVIQEFKQVNKQLEETRKKYEQTNCKYEKILSELSKKIESVDKLEKSLIEVRESLNLRGEKEKILSKALEDRKQIDKIILREVKSMKKKAIVELSENVEEIVVENEEKEQLPIILDIMKYLKLLENEIFECKKEKVMINGKFDYKNIFEIKRRLENMEKKSREIRMEIQINPQIVKDRKDLGMEFTRMADKVKELSKDIDKYNINNYEVIRKEGKELYTNLIVVNQIIKG